MLEGGCVCVCVCGHVFVVRVVSGMYVQMHNAVFGVCRVMRQSLGRGGLTWYGVRRGMCTVL